MRSLLPLALLIPAFFCVVRSGSLDEGALCIGNNDHIDPSTQKFITECGSKYFCSAGTNGTCIPRQCRRDEFAFGYAPTETVPPLCAAGSFCPDNGSACTPWRPVGDACELGRDEQCAPPDDADRATWSSKQNFNGSVCLQMQCRYANVTVGQPCVIDNTTYMDVGVAGEPSSIVVTRDNCRTEYFCDGTSSTCVPTQALGSLCQTDQQCSTYNCGSQGLCTDPPETPVRVAPWQYALTGICIAAAMVATCVMLTFVHKRHRHENYKEIREYYTEQITLRRNIIALHSSAAARYSYGDEKAVRY
ncbi:hypothetical protein PLICRDRAFT_337586 [Plicaturopsis crispa FD-325 SS-3]|uniref:Dickkopf N-terminal cysteine-rich domain-containing protein n=1 Tax=Plicaturopsis crispa FD-325 SS-3 TaxID=944288 RepID=A0A0C9TAE8_PLICR|nr:hypothetical protein PLICRDRAFT_337586 [Plicaturopsis crispa FD-325 SS-3]